MKLKLKNSDGDIYSVTDDSVRDSQINGINTNILAMQNVTGAKNLNIYPYLNTTKTENGITFTDNGDGSVTVSGVASVETYFVCHVHTGENLLKLEKQIYEGNGCPNGGSLNAFFVRFYYVDQLGNGVYFDDIGNGTSIIDLRGITDYFHEDAVIRFGIMIYVKAGTDLSTPITCKPMIRPAGTDPTWVPYAMTNEQLTKRVEYEGDGVSAIKVGYTVTVSVAKTTTTFSVGWNVLGTLPSAFRPKKTIRFNGLDDNINVWSESWCLPLMINAIGEVKMWGFNSHLTTSVVGCITYIV